MLATSGLEAEGLRSNSDLFICKERLPWPPTFLMPCMSLNPHYNLGRGFILPSFQKGTLGLRHQAVGLWLPHV